MLQTEPTQANSVPVLSFNTSRKDGFLTMVTTIGLHRRTAGIVVEIIASTEHVLLSNETRVGFNRLCVHLDCSCVNFILYFIIPFLLPFFHDFRQLHHHYSIAYDFRNEFTATNKQQNNHDNNDQIKPFARTFMLWVQRQQRQQQQQRRWNESSASSSFL